MAIKSKVDMKRTVWMKERSDHWWGHIVSNTFTEDDWLENFRMSHNTFLHVCDELRNDETMKEDTIMRQCIHVEKRIAICIWRLATNSSYREIGQLFGVSKASVCQIVNSVEL